MTECTGYCATCDVDHSKLGETTNRGHGISYSDKVKEYVYKTDHMNRDENFNLLLEEDGKSIFMGEFGGPACGDIVNIWVKLADNHNTIEDAKFLSTGCWGSISSSAYGCEQIIGKNLFDIDIRALNEDIMRTLDLPQIKKHCSIFIGQCLEQIKEKVNKIVNY